jgi:aminomethyltransferase
MGECLVEGKGASEYLDYLCTNAISSLEPNKVMYTMMCYPNGTVVDDLLVYRLDSSRYMLVLNAANTEKDLAWIMEQNPHAEQCPAVTDISEKTALLALQGPLSERILAGLFPGCTDIGPFSFDDHCRVGTVDALVSRTGYTGEDGFELYCDASEAAVLWHLLLDRGKEYGLSPCGLGARDTLRIEARLPLYGHEISDSITPLEANLGMFVHLEKTGFCGKEALERQKLQGIPRTLRGVEMVQKSVPRAGCPVFLGEREIGYVTSGTKSPTLDIFCAYVLIERGTGLGFGDEVEIEIHGQRKRARLVKTPFYKRTKSDGNR